VNPNVELMMNTARNAAKPSVMPNIATAASVLSAYRIRSAAARAAGG